MESDGWVVGQRDNNDMSHEKGDLTRTLRLSIKQAEDASASSSPRFRDIFEAIRKFLIRWEALKDAEVNVQQQQDGMDANESQDLPCDYLKMVFCRILSNLHPVKNVDTVRQEILSILRSLQTNSCRQLLLDFLLSVSRTFVGNETHSNTWAEGKSKRAKKQILSCLREVFDNDPNSLSQILKYFSSVLTDAIPRKYVIAPRDAFLFVVETLPKVPETNLHIALKALIEYINSTEDARLAIDCVRTELALLEKTDISDMAPVAATFDEAVQGASKSQEFFVEQYFIVLEELVDEQNSKKYQSRFDNDDHLEAFDNQLLTFDLVMMILLKDSIVHRDRILHMVSDCSLLESGLFSNEHLKRVVELVDNNQRPCSDTLERLAPLESNPRPHLLELLTDFSISFLLAPLHRTVEFESNDFFSLIQDLLVRMILELPKDFQNKAISLALQVVDELVKTSENESAEQLQRKTKTKFSICLSVFLLLLSLESRQRQILLPFQDRLVNYITSESFGDLEKTELRQTLCTIVAKVIGNSDSSGALKSIVICRTLLYSPPMYGARTTATQMEGELISRQIRGMVFANTIISSYNLDPPLLAAMHKMTSRILLSSYSNISMLNARIGSEGMKLLRRIRDHDNCDHSMGKHLFKIASLVLSHSRIVHYPNNLAGESKTKSSSIFAYNETPCVFPFDKIPPKHLKIRKMLFRFNFFANETLLSEPLSWEISCLWIFDVIDTYLALGRTTKWNPRPWIFAGIEFPDVASSTSALMKARRKQKLLNYLESHFSSFAPAENYAAPMTRIDKQILELMKGAKAIVEKEAVVNSLSRFALALLFALSVSIAVINNTFSHFEHLFDAGRDKTECNEKNEAFQMMHYQLTKIYHIEQTCHSMERLFRNLGSRSISGTRKTSNKTKKRKLNKTSVAAEKTKIQIKAETIAVGIRNSLLKTVHCREVIQEQVFWECLTDPSHDSLIVSVVENLRHEERTDKMLVPVLKVIQLRLNLIKHLSIIISHDKEAENGGVRAVFEGSALRCLRITAFLLLNFPLLNSTAESGEVTEGLLKLIPEYLRLTTAIFISKKGHSEASTTDSQEISGIFGIYLSTFGSEQPLNRTFEGQFIGDSRHVEDFNKLVSSFGDHIDGIHSPISSQLLEILSVFAVESGWNILNRMIDIHWNATFLSKYMNVEKHEGSNSAPPFALVKVFKLLSRTKSKGLSKASSEEYCSHRAITKLMNHRYNKSLDKHRCLVHSMRRHWGLLSLSKRKFNLIPKFLSNLFGKLDQYLHDVDDHIVEDKQRTKDNKVFTNDDEDDDDEYLPPATSTPTNHKPTIPTTSSGFGCLTSSSYPIYLDMLLRMTVSSIALFSIPEEMKRFRRHEPTSSKDHPVYVLERMVVVFGGLVKLYRDKYHIFPKFLQSSIISVSKCMLDVAVMKSQEYIKWRNQQPLLHFAGDESRELDVASTAFLKKVLDSFGVYAVGTLHTFCSAYSGSDTIQGERTKQIQSGTKLVFGDSPIPGLKILARKTQRTFEFLSEMSNRYGTGVVRTDDTEQHVSQQKEDEASTNDSEDFSKTEYSSTMDESSEKRPAHESQKGVESKTNLSLRRKRDSRRDTPTRSGESYEHSQSEDEGSFIDEDEQSSSSSSDAFGVSGDWGQESEDSDEESHSEFFVNRFQKSS